MDSIKLLLSNLKKQKTLTDAYTYSVIKSNLLEVLNQEFAHLQQEFALLNIAIQTKDRKTNITLKSTKPALLSFLATEEGLILEKLIQKLKEKKLYPQNMGIYITFSKY